jgi:general secretion pathway protein G
MPKTVLKWIILSIIVAIIGVVWLVPPYFGHIDTKLQRAKSDIDILSQALELYKKDHGTFPDTIQGLSVLIAPEGNTYLDNLPTDPWGNEYLYQYPGVHNISGFDLSSRGPSANNASYVSNWKAKED